MSVEKTITLARSHLLIGNSGAYHRIMEGAIRAARSEKIATRLRHALESDIAGGK